MVILQTYLCRWKVWAPQSDSSSDTVKLVHSIFAVQYILKLWLSLAYFSLGTGHGTFLSPVLFLLVTLPLFSSVLFKLIASIRLLFPPVLVSTSALLPLSYVVILS